MLALRVLAVGLLACAGVAVCQSSSSTTTPGLNASSSAAAPPTLSGATSGLILLDNDPSQTAVTEHLLALRAGYRVLGLTTVLGDVSAADGTAHLVRLLELQNLSCIPVVQGADGPLLRTNASLRAWEAQYGVWPWAGAWRPDYPTGAAQFPFGEPAEDSAALSAARNRTAAEFLVEQVRAHPGGQVTLYAAGPLTNIALALRLWPDFANEVKELVVQGGFTDYSRAFSQGSAYTADLWADFNLQLDPEASAIVLSAPFPSITLVGNGANEYIPSTALFAQLNSTAQARVQASRGDGSANVSAEAALEALPSARLFSLNAGQGGFPLWDESAVFVAVASPRSDAVNDSFAAPATVDTARDSPYYGRPYLFSTQYLPTAVQYRNVSFVNSIHVEPFKQAVIDALTTDWSAYCSS